MQNTQKSGVCRIICVVNRPAVAISSNSSTVFQQFQHVPTVLYQARTGEEQKCVNWNGRELWRPLCKILIICENHIFSIFPCIICAFVIRSNSSQFSPSPLVTKGYFFSAKVSNFDWNHCCLSSFPLLSQLNCSLKPLPPFSLSSSSSVKRIAAACVSSRSLCNVDSSIVVLLVVVVVVVLLLLVLVALAVVVSSSSSQHPGSFPVPWSAAR